MSTGSKADETISVADVRARFQRRYRKQRNFFALFDRALSVVTRAASVGAAPLRSLPPPPPRKLLICNTGHLGDVVITLSLLPALKQAFPEVEIGLLTGSWNKALVEGAALISRVHYVDHWFQVRGPASRRDKMKAYFRSLPALIREIRAVGYDTGVDVRSWFPNSITTLWQARIPVRIGFSRVGFAPLLTHSVTHYFDRRHERDHQSAPLRRLPIDGALLDAVPERWLSAKESGKQVVQTFTSHSGPLRYAVLHPGASTPVRDWTENGWRELARNILKSGAIPVFTGLGSEQEQSIDQIIAEVPGAVSLCSKISWRQLMAVIAEADTVYCVETSVGHLAGALGVPNVAIYGGMQDPQQWKPAGRRVALVTHPMPCNPCFQANGCESLGCLRNIPAADVWRAGRELAASP